MADESNRGLGQRDDRASTQNIQSAAQRFLPRSRIITAFCLPHRTVIAGAICNGRHLADVLIFLRIQTRWVDERLQPATGASRGGSARGGRSTCVLYFVSIFPSSLGGSCGGFAGAGGAWFGRSWCSWSRSVWCFSVSWRAPRSRLTRPCRWTGRIGSKRRSSPRPISSRTASRPSIGNQHGTFARNCERLPDGAARRARVGRSAASLSRSELHSHRERAGSGGARAPSRRLRPEMHACPKARPYDTISATDKLRRSTKRRGPPISAERPIFRTRQAPESARDLNARERTLTLGRSG
jgi:hypothetical protein